MYPVNGIMTAMNTLWDHILKSHKFRENKMKAQLLKRIFLLSEKHYIRTIWQVMTKKLECCHSYPEPYREEI